MWPAFKRAPRVVRQNARDRAKLLILVGDFGPKLQRQDAKEPARKAELLARGHGNVAGLHTSGAPYQLLTGELMVFSRSEIQDILELWIPKAYTAADNKPAQQAAPLSAVTRPEVAERGVNDVHEAILWWISRNEVAVLAHMSRCAPGKYIALRADDNTPSVTRTDLKDGFGRATFRDYGSGQTLDVFDIYCLLNHFDKRKEVGKVVREWREATKK